MDPLLAQRLKYNKVRTMSRVYRDGKGKKAELTLSMLVAQGALAHIRELDGTLGASIHKPVATQRVEFRGSYDFRQLFHVSRFDVHYVETLVLNVQVPKVDPQIVAADKGLAIAVDGDAVDMIGVSVCVRSARHSGNDSVVMG